MVNTLKNLKNKNFEQILLLQNTLDKSEDKSDNVAYLDTAFYKSFYSYLSPFPPYRQAGAEFALLDNWERIVCL